MKIDYIDKMDYIDKYIFKSLKFLGENVNTLAKIELKRHRQFLFVSGFIGAIVFLQRNEIKNLQERMFDAESTIYELQEELFSQKVRESNAKEVASDK